MIKSLACVTLATVLLAGCASQSAYAPATKSYPEGYSETKLSANRYRVSFAGNTQTPPGTVKDYALLRSAELTLEQGQDWFRVVDRNTDKKVRHNTTVSGGDAFYTPQTMVYQNCGLLGCKSTVVSAPAYTVEPGVASTTSSASYMSELEVVIGKNPKPADLEAYDAREVAANLHQRMQQQAQKQ